MTSGVGADPLAAATTAVEAAESVVEAAIAALAKGGGVDEDQVVAYDLAHAAAGAMAARSMLDYATRGEVERDLTCLFVADTLVDLAGRAAGREALWGVEPGWSSPAAAFLAWYRDPAFVAGLCGQTGPTHLDEDFELVRETFHRFAEEKVRPHAEEVHRKNLDVPEEVIAGLAALGGFGLSVPEEFGGFASGTESDYMGMVVATEELSWGALVHRRLAHHPSRDPDPRPREGRDRPAEA